ncbi:MAG TPA: dTMP kinase [Isosphaeraceae bacterium]|nr:dTMP kinase [Isosphaeraceae bacterium]
MTAPDGFQRTVFPGYFISLDGPDGGGKTTQAAMLVKWLRALGHDVVACRDPGGTGVGERLRPILLERQDLHISLRTEMLLYMASRAQLVEEVIRPALEAGRIVVSDRFLLANVVYQGYAGGLPVHELWRVGQSATGGLLPDLTLLLDVPAEVAQARVGAPRDRIEDRSDDYRQRVRDGFLDASKTYPARIVVVNAAAEAEAVCGRLQSEVSRGLAERARA